MHSVDDLLGSCWLVTTSQTLPALVADHLSEAVQLLRSFRVAMNVPISSMTNTGCCDTSVGFCASTRDKLVGDAFRRELLVAKRMS